MNPKLRINVSQIHAVQMLHVTRVYARASEIILATHTVDAIRNVFSIVNVRVTKLVFEISVLIHALECVASKQSVPLLIISRCVIVCLVTQEMLTLLA